MEVRIGVLHAPREVVLESTESVDTLQANVDAAIASGSTLRLHDEKGRVILVPGALIAYVDIAATDARRVGFGGASS